MLVATQFSGFGSGGEYRANGVSFDGTNDWLNRGADLSGSADSKLWTGSLWYRHAVTGVADRLSSAGNVSNDLAATTILSDDKFQIFGRNAGSTLILEIRSTVAKSDTLWHHVCWCVDLADAAKRFLFVDDVSTLSVLTYTNDSIDFTVPEHYIARQNLGSLFNGCLADIWLGYGVYFDINVLANRRKFIDADKRPVFLGNSGELPTGTSPIIFFSGPTAGWETNDGTGGGYTKNGAPTACATSPSD